MILSGLELLLIIILVMPEKSTLARSGSQDRSATTGILSAPEQREIAGTLTFSPGAQGYDGGYRKSQRRVADWSRFSHHATHNAACRSSDEEVRESECGGLLRSSVQRECTNLRTENEYPTLIRVLSDKTTEAQGHRGRLSLIR